MRLNEFSSPLGFLLFNTILMTFTNSLCTAHSTVPGIMNATFISYDFDYITICLCSVVSLVCCPMVFTCSVFSSWLVLVFISCCFFVFVRFCILKFWGFSWLLWLWHVITDYPCVILLTCVLIPAVDFDIEFMHCVPPSLPTCYNDKIYFLYWSKSWLE